MSVIPKFEPGMRRGRHMGSGRRDAFTLVEMLVVIGVMMLLMGLLMPVFSTARQIAKKTRAKTEVKQLDMAWKSVLADYRSWTAAGLGSSPGKIAMDDGWADYLAGEDSRNSKGVAYMEFDGRSTNTTWAMRDPWDNIYQVALGKDQVTPYDVPIYRNVAAWSKGADGKDDTTQTRKDDVKSWE